MVTHHDGVLQEQEVGAPPELLYFGQGPRRSGGSPHGDELGEFELILLACVLTVFPILTI